MTTEITESQSARCGRRCGPVCGLTVCTWEGPRPRWHWESARFTSPTTRPPRSSEEGGVRVVGLDPSWDELPAGAGPGGWLS
jgi:hypothetical protein